MSNKIPTAEAFLEDYNKGKGYLMLSKEEFTDTMIKFANLHRKAALEAAVKIEFDLFKDPKEEILKCYPESKIV